MTNNAPIKAALAACALLTLGACAGGTFTGPVQVTRFVNPQPTGLGSGTIALRFSEELTNEAAKTAFRAALGDELGSLGYTVIDNEEIADQIATIETSRSSQAAPTNQRGPVNVGVGGGTGGFGSGVGVGIGLNLGGGQRSPRVVSELSVAIASNQPGGPAQNLWEARAQFPTSVNSPYAPVAINARTLAAALFEDFPGGDGETIEFEARDLVEQ